MWIRPTRSTAVAATGLMCTISVEMPNAVHGVDQERRTSSRTVAQASSPPAANSAAQTTIAAWYPVAKVTGSA